MACLEQMMRPVLTSFSICLWNAFMCILSFWDSVVLLLIWNLALLSLQSLALLCLFQWGNCSLRVCSVTSDVFFLFCHPLQREPSLGLFLFCLFPLKGRRTVLWLFWKLTSNVLTSEFWLKGWVSLGVSPFGTPSRWLNYELWLWYLTLNLLPFLVS